MLREELLWVIGLFVAVVLAAALVNRVRPQHRRRLRRLVVTYAMYAVAVGLVIAFDAIDRPTWSSSVAVAAELLQAYVLVMVSAALVFSVLLPAIGTGLPLIASDLIVGLGIVASTLVVLARNGMNPTNALVSGAVISAVLAISLQSTLGNILGGIALQLDGSIGEGDWLQLDGPAAVGQGARVGRVRAVRWRHTVVETREGSTIIVPNAQLLAQSITLLGKRDGATSPQRIGVNFAVDFRYPPNQVTRTVTEALRGSPIDNVAADPPPLAACTDLAKDSREALVAYVARYSIIDLAHEEATSSRVRARIHAALGREGIQLSVPATLAFGEVSDDVAGKRARRELDERVAALHGVHLFQTFAADELAELAKGLKPVAFAEGEVIFRQGAVARSLYILASGRAEVRTNVDPDGPGGEPERPVVVAEIAAPDFFGERGLMTGEPRAANVIALSDVRCFRLDKETFQSILLARPEIATELSERLAARRVELEAARDGLDATAKAARGRGESERLRRAITSFFGL